MPKTEKNEAAISQIVAVRVKMPNSDPEYVQMADDGQSITVKMLKQQKPSFLKHQISSYSFHFSNIFKAVDNGTIFNGIVRPLVDGALAGTNGVLFCVGGVKSGKSYTLYGLDGMDYSQRGVVSRAISYAFEKGLPRLRVSYVEFQGEVLFDVLQAYDGHPQPELLIQEGKGGAIDVKNLFQPEAKSEQAAHERMFGGNCWRSFNPEHLTRTSIFTLYIERSKLHFVEVSQDRAAMTVLERVLIADHDIPYRNSPVTHFLKDSMSRRVVLAHVELDRAHLRPSLNSLKFASRAQGERSDDILNLKEHSDTAIRRLKGEIEETRARLKVRTPGVSFTEPSAPERRSLSEQSLAFLTDAVTTPPMRSLFEIRAALSLMRDQYRAQCVTIEEGYREKFVFAVIAAPDQTEEGKRVEEPVAIDVVENPCVFPLAPGLTERYIVFRSMSDQAKVIAELSEKRRAISENLRLAVAEVNWARERVYHEKEEARKMKDLRFPDVDGALVVSEDEPAVWAALAEAKQRYKSAYERFAGFTEQEGELTQSILGLEAEVESNFHAMLEEEARAAAAARAEEEDEADEFLSAAERRERRELTRFLEANPKGEAFYHAWRRVQIILRREFRPNGTRRFPAIEC